MSTPLTIRPATAGDVAFLKEMLWQAAAANPEVRTWGKEKALAYPDISRYLKNWGRPGDLALIAEDKTGRRLGASWYRLFDGPRVPELVTGVSPSIRGRGVGTALIEALAVEAQKTGYSELALSVDKVNPAISLYRRLGFTEDISDPTSHFVKMRKVLKQGG